MSCCPDIEDINTGFTQVVYDPMSMQNVEEINGQLFRDGGVVGTGDAYADTTDWVEGTDCAMWVWTIVNSGYPPDDYECNLVNYFIYPEDVSTGVDGWGFTNQTVSFRRSPFLNTVPQFPVFFRNTELGYNRFAIYYNNGTVWLLETSEIGTADPGWIGPPSYARGGLPTGTRYRLRVTVKNSAVDCHSSVVTQFMGAQSPCGSALWTLPPLDWSATGLVTANSIPRVDTMRFDQGAGSSYYLIPPVIDSGNELRSKVIKSMRATGRRTNVSMKAYGYDINDEINTTDLEEGTNASTRAQDLDDSTQVAQSKRKPINVKNAVLSTVRLEGSDVGQEERDEIHEIVVEQADSGVRR